MTYIPIISPILTNDSNNNPIRKKSAFFILLLISGIMLFAGVFFWQKGLFNNPEFTITTPTIFIFIMIISGILIVITIAYRFEMRSPNQNQNQTLKVTSNIQDSIEIKHIPEKIPQHCRSCHNSIDAEALKGLLQHGIIFCQFCGEKITFT